jgi:hypothetical protein
MASPRGLIFNKRVDGGMFPGFYPGLLSHRPSGAGHLHCIAFPGFHPGLFSHRPSGAEARTLTPKPYSLTPDLCPLI